MKGLTARGQAMRRFRAGVKYYKKHGVFRTRSKNKGGSGHDAGYKWGEAKGIDPTSRVRKYSKNSPSFDEGVYKYKQNAKSRALESMKH